MSKAKFSTQQLPKFDGPPKSYYIEIAAETIEDQRGR